MGSSALELGKLRPREAQGPAAIRAGIRIRCSRLPGWRSFCPSCLLPDAAGNGATVTRSSTPQAASWFWVFPEDQARAAKMMRTDVHLCLGTHFRFVPTRAFVIFHVLQREYPLVLPFLHVFN